LKVWRKQKKIEDKQRIKKLKIQWPCMQTENRYGESFSLTECERYVKNKINQKNARRNDLSRKREEYRRITIVRDLTTVFIRAVIECMSNSMKLIQHVRKGETVA
jgi:hypothetical protein